MIIQQEKNIEMFEGSRNMHIRYSVDDNEYSFFSKGWEELFRNSNSFEKAIYSIEWYFEYLFSDYDKRINVIPFEIFVKNPEEYINTISSQLESPLTKQVYKEMKNQKVPLQMQEVKVIWIFCM